MSHKAFLILGAILLVLGLLLSLAATIGLFTDFMITDDCLVLVECGVGLVIGGTILLAEVKKKEDG